MLLIIHTIILHFQNSIFYLDFHIKILQTFFTCHVCDTQIIISPFICIRCKWVVSTKLRPLYIKGNSPTSHRSERRQVSAGLDVRKNKKKSCPLRALRWWRVLFRGRKNHSQFLAKVRRCYCYISCRSKTTFLYILSNSLFSIYLTIRWNKPKIEDFK